MEKRDWAWSAPEAVKELGHLRSTWFAPRGCSLVLVGVKIYVWKQKQLGTPTTFLLIINRLGELRCLSLEKALGRPESPLQRLKRLQESLKGTWDKAWIDKTHRMASLCQRQG